MAGGGAVLFSQDKCQGPPFSPANQDVPYAGECQIFNIAKELLATVPSWTGALDSSKMGPTLGFGGKATAVPESYKGTALRIFLLCNPFCGGTSVSGEPLSVFKGHHGRGTAFPM